MDKTPIFNSYHWPYGYQLALALTGVGCVALAALWLGTVALRTTRILVRGYPTRRI